MNIFLESEVVVGAIGLLAIVMAGIVYSQTRSRGSLIAVTLLALLTILAIGFEQWYQTPTEQVTAKANELFDAIESNDLPAVLKLLDPSATDMIADAEVLMPQFKVQNAGSDSLKIEFDDPANPATATINTKALIKALHTQTGITGAYFDGLELTLVKTNDEWHFSGYRPAKDWRKEAGKLGK